MKDILQFGSSQKQRDIDSVPHEAQRSTQNIMSCFNNVGSQCSFFALSLSLSKVGKKNVCKHTHIMGMYMCFCCVGFESVQKKTINECHMCVEHNHGNGITWLWSSFVLVGDIGFYHFKCSHAKLQLCSLHSQIPFGYLTCPLGLHFCIFMSLFTNSMLSFCHSSHTNYEENFFYFQHFNF